MFSLILTVAMMPVQSAPKTAQFQPCVWPNKCVETPVAQFQPCVWPNKCAQTSAARA